MAILQCCGCKSCFWIGVIGVAAIAVIYSRYQRPAALIDIPEQEYDYIIVGSGSAGSVLSRRLSEGLSEDKILVIEAGGEEPWLSTVPFLGPLLQGGVNDWAYLTTPQEHAFKGLNNKQGKWPRGKMLGGSGNLNAMVHFWATKKDVKMWNAWKYEDVEPFFKKSETFMPSDSTSRKHKKPGHRGDGGPIQVTELDPAVSPLHQAFLDSARLLGFSLDTDLNRDDQYGATSVSAAISSKGQRSSPSSVYLRPALSNPNLNVLLNTFAHKVLLSEGRASSVQLNGPKGEKWLVRARKEVLVCAGALGSPALLMRSGIGPKEELHRHQIPVLVESPEVGKNLLDQLIVPIFINITEPVSCNSAKVKSISNIMDYFIRGKGYFSTSGVEAVLRAPGGDNLPDVMLLLFNLGSFDHVFMKNTNTKPEVFSAVFPDYVNDSKEGFVLLASCLHPLSRGQITFKDSEGQELNVDPKYLKHPDDRTCFRRAFSLAHEFLKQPPLLKLGAVAHLPKLRDCPFPSLEDEAYQDCLAAHVGCTFYHPMSTCSVGKVLDHQFRVKGVKDLRVVDASAIPNQISGFPNSGVVALAEMASHFLLADRKSR